MNFNIGKLYQVKKYYWLLYPSKDIADHAALFSVERTDDLGAAAYFSKHYNCNVSYIKPNDIFCLLAEDVPYIPENSIFTLLEKKDRKFLKILSPNGEMGWIGYQENKDWRKGCIEEVNQRQRSTPPPMPLATPGQRAMPPLILANSLTAMFHIFLQTVFSFCLQKKETIVKWVGSFIQKAN